MSCQQKSVTNYLCLSLKGEFLNTLGGCMEKRMHEGQLWERASWGALVVGGWVSGVLQSLVSDLVFFFCPQRFRALAGDTCSFSIWVLAC